MKKLLCILLTICLLMALLSGCGNGDSAASSSQQSESVAVTVPTENHETAEISDFTEESSVPPEDAPVLTEEQQALLALIPEGEVLTFQTYPLSQDEDATLSLFYSMHPLLGQFYETAADLPISAATEEITGVHIEYNCVSFMAADTQIQLMMAAGDMDDIMPLAMNYAGGPDAAVDEELIVDLTEYLPEYAVNYQALIDYNETFKNQVTTAEGRVVGFSIYAMDKSRIYTYGPEIRKDWLDQVKLDVPVTIDDYHEMLLAFKNQLDVETPMYLHYSGINKTNQLTRAYDINGTELLIIDGTVTSSLLQPGMKDYLKMMNQWWQEGLFAQDFFSDTSAEEPELSVVANSYGLFYQYATEFPEIENLAEDPNFELLSITDAVLEEGDKFSVYNGYGNDASPAGYYNVTTSCDDIELALKWLDFYYSPDGWLLSNYGNQGESFEYAEDGTPHWTDVINYPEVPSYVAKSTYTLLQGAFLMHAEREFDSYTEAMIDASDIWASVEADGDYINLPPYITLSTEQSEIVTPIQNDIDTYVDECLVKFIIGDMNLEDDYDSFVERIKTMNIDTVMEAYQEAYEKFLEVQEK